MRVPGPQLLVLSACLLLAPSVGAEPFQTSLGLGKALSGAIEGEFGELLPPSLFADGCGKTVGLLGSSFFPELDDTITGNGMTLLLLDAAAIAGGSLASVDVLYCLRGGMFDAMTEAATIDTWIRAGGVMITEFDSTTIFYQPGPLNYLSGVMVSGFHVPSGTVCGGNTVVVNDPGHPLAEGLPSSWDCSGDPIAVLKVYAGIDPSLCVIASIAGSDADGDGNDDPVVAVADVGNGAIIPFFSDFGDWQALEDPRDCSGGATSASCMRSIEDETLLLNALCRVTGCSSGCGDCEALHATIDAMEMDNEGVRNSFHAKAASACRAFERDKLNTAGNTLCALLNHNRAQFDKHVSADSAIALENCVRAFAEKNGIPLDSGICGSVLD